jgi:hypothetical protein
VFDAAHRAALDSGKSLIYVCPPAPWAVRPLFQRLASGTGEALDTLVLAPDGPDALALFTELAVLDARRPAHVVTGLTRSAKRLSTGVRTLVATPPDMMELLARSAPRMQGLRQVVVCWPEMHEATEALDAVLHETSTSPRLVVTADPGACSTFLERHARRAPVLHASHLPTEPVSRVRYALVSAPRVVSAVRDLLDSHAPSAALVWDPTALAATRWTEFDEDPSVSLATDPASLTVELAIAVDLPTAEALAALRAAARDVVVLLRAPQLSYLRRLTSAMTPVRLRSEADRALDWRAALRARVRERIETDVLDSGLVTLAPLLDDYDPALLAAAVLAVPATEPTPAASLGGAPLWVHLNLNLGRRDGLRPADVVGALLNAAGLDKEDIGRVDIRDAFSVVEVRAEAGEQARSGLDGIQLRNRTAAARFDRK